MKSICLIILLIVFAQSLLQNCFSYQNVTTNMILNPSFTSTSCSYYAYYAVCNWAKNNFSTSYIPNWLPQPQIQILRQYYYSGNRFSPDKWSVSLTGTFNTCIKQTLTNIDVGKYQIFIQYGPHMYSNLANAKIQLKFDNQFVSNYTPTSVNLATITQQIVINTSLPSTQITICGVGEASYYDGAILSSVQMYYQKCIQCQSGHGLVGNVCTACNTTCACGGWKSPKVNGVCNTTCGDGLIRGSQQCDDGNLISNDGCSSTCKSQTCNKNCSCDGWYKPLTNGICKTVCGDGYKRNKQQCDDGNIFPNDGCDQYCMVEPLFVSKQNTNWISLVLFIFGFRINGLQALNVIQHFQLLLDKYGGYTFQISYFIHGYVNNQLNLFSYFDSSQSLSNFNFMFFILMLLILLIFFLSFFKDSSEIKNINKIHLNETNQNLDHSNLRSRHQKQKNFNIDNSNQSNSSNMNNNQNSQSQNNSIQNNLSKTQKIGKLSIIILYLKRVLFLLFINCLSIFCNSLSLQFIKQGVKTLENSSVILYLIMMNVLLVVLLNYCSNRNILMGQVQQKFKSKQWMTYWIIIIIQKILFSILASFNELWTIIIQIVIKIMMILYFVKNTMFSDKIDNMRNVFTQIFHLGLLVTLTYFEYGIKASNNQNKDNINTINILYLALLIITLVVSLISMLRQIYFNVKAIIKSNKLKKKQNRQINANSSELYPVKNKQMVNFMDMNRKIKNVTFLETQREYQNNQKKIMKTTRNQDNFLRLTAKNTNKIQNLNNYPQQYEQNIDIAQNILKNSQIPDTNKAQYQDMLYNMTNKSFKLKRQLKRKQRQ